MPAPRHTHTQSCPSDHPLRHQVTTPTTTRTYSSLAFSCSCLFRWAGSRRMTESPVNHGGSRGSLPPLAPTHTHVHARVPTHSPVTRACVRCRYLSHTYGGGCFAAAALVLPLEVGVSEARLSARGERSRHLSCRCSTSDVSAPRCPPHVGNDDDRWILFTERQRAKT